jgi:cytochrome b
MHTIRVWDLPTRLFHWALVICVIGLVVTANVGGNWMAWHFRFGYSVLTLLLFRMVWGLVGGHWSRFSSFLYAPSTLLRYLRGQGEPSHSVGHSPVGALSVFAMLLVLLAQVGTGLVSDDEIASSGPLVRFVSGHITSLATSYHKNVGRFIVIGLVVLHLAAIAYYRWAKKEKLVLAMIVGDKSIALPAPAVRSSQDTAGTRLLALVLLLACALFVRWLVSLGDLAGF